MTETERAKVGHALDALRDALAPYVDAAMVTAYGPQWDEHVAEEDAKRGPSRRQQIVSKDDLAVMLKAIRYRRIEPWGGLKSYAYPRIQSFASEILTLRNMYSHGKDCNKEHARLLDTASRFLELLDLPVPDGLRPPDRAAPEDPGARKDIAVPEAPPIPFDLFDIEVARLGEQGERLAEMLSKAAELPTALARQIDALAHSLENQESNSFQSQRRVSVLAIGAEAFELMDETYRLEADGEHDSTVQKVLIQLIRCSLSDPLVYSAVLGHISVTFLEFPTAEPELDAVRDRMNLMEKWMGQDPIDSWRELVQLAHHLQEGSAIANSLIMLGNFNLSANLAIESDEALELLRDSSTRARMLAAMDPGSQYETFLVQLLRREGAICNDLGRSDEATRAFARADEIIDRYPAADPDLTPR